MSDHEIFTTEYAVDKGTWVHIADDTGFRKHIENHLGHRLAERIFQECQNGEKIVTVGEPYTKEIIENYQIVMRADVRVEELVRCKDCRFHEQEQLGMVYCPATVGGWVEENWFCKGGERREE